MRWHPLLYFARQSTVRRSPRTTLQGATREWEERGAPSAPVPLPGESQSSTSPFHRWRAWCGPPHPADAAAQPSCARACCAHVSAPPHRGTTRPLKSTTRATSLRLSLCHLPPSRASHGDSNLRPFSIRTRACYHFTVAQPAHRPCDRRCAPHPPRRLMRESTTTHVSIVSSVCNSLYVTHSM